MIFEQSFFDNFLFRTYILFLLSLYCFGFCVNTHISLYISVVPQVVNKIVCSNITPFM